VAAAHARGAPARYAALSARRDRLERAHTELLPGAVPNGAEPRAPHVISLAWPGRLGPELVAALDLEGVSLSSGSACSAGTVDPSPVITAMHDRARAAASVRLSLGELTTEDDVDVALAAFARVAARFCA
jgi:cysteine desulfurase